MTPLISIIIPIYKVEPFLRKCLDSVVAQTYSHIEIILVDDGSPDKSGEICDEYAANDSRIKVIYQEYKGVSAARNAGLDNASGDYIMFVDSDDWIEQNACESVLSFAQLYHADMVCYGYNEVTHSGVMPRTFEGELGVVENKELLKGMTSGWSYVRDYCWNKFVSRKLYDGIRFPLGRVYEDIGTVYKIVHHAERIYLTDKILYNYVIHDGSITSTPYLINQVEDRAFFLKERLDFLRMYYPDLFDIQLSMIIRLLLVCRDRTEGKENYRIINDELTEIVEKYKSRMQDLTGYSKIVWIYYYCPILLKLFMKIRRYLIN